MSTSGSLEKEDWLDLGDLNNAPTFSLEDALNDTENLSDPFLDEQFAVDGEFGSVSNLTESTAHSPDSHSLTYKLDSAFVIQPHQVISHQILSNEKKTGRVIAVAERNGWIAVVTSKGQLLLFDLNGNLNQFHRGDETMGGASCVTFSLDGKFLAIGLQKGAIKIMTIDNKLYHMIDEGGQPGQGIIQVIYTKDNHTVLTLDNGGSFYECTISKPWLQKRKDKLRCHVSGCNGEVISMKMMPGDVIALLSVHRLIFYILKPRGQILGIFPIKFEYQFPPACSFWLGTPKTAINSPLNSLYSTTLKDFRVCISRGNKLAILRIHANNFFTKYRRATVIRQLELPCSLVNIHWMSNHMIVGIDSFGAVWQIDPEKGTAKKQDIEDLQLVFSTPILKGSATGGRVSEAVKAVAEFACYQSVTSATSTSERLIVLAHDGLKYLEKVHEWEQLERYKERNDVISASLYLLDVCRDKVRASEMFKRESHSLLAEKAHSLLTETVAGVGGGALSDLLAHYRKYIRVLLKVCITGRLLDFLYIACWDRLSMDSLSKTVFLDHLDEYVLDGALIDPPPPLVNEYLQHLAAEGHFSQFQSAVVRFPIHTLDLHTVMSICKQNSIYDGIIYVNMKIFMALSLLCYTNAQVDRDWSFQQMCEFWGGEQTYRARSGYKESAQRYCEETVPYHINNPKASEYKTTCEAEATLICKSGWVQMFGRCYKITKTMMTRDKAEEHCKNQQDQTSTIAFMHREALPFRWNDYFTRVSRIWMDASEVVTNDLIHDVEGGNVLLAFDGYKYNLPNVAIARVSKNETAMVLCEYTPSMTKAESNYLLRRYGEIYYPPLVTSESAYMRTTSSRIRNEEDPLADHNYCTELMKPVFRGGEAQSALPTQEFVKKLTETGAAEIIRTSSVSMNANKGERTIVDCVSHVDPYHRVHVKGDKNEETSITLNKTIWRQQEPHETCDAATWSSAAVLSRDSNRGLEAMSDARYAPLYCENILEYFSYSKCPEGFSEFPRVTSGQRWCHKYVHGAPLPYDDAEKKCAEMGAHLSGFTTQEEFKFLNELVNKEYPNKNDIEVWLGAQRKMSCPDAGKNFNGGFSTNEFDNCARSRVFEWRNGVAKNPPDFIGSGYDNWAELDEPNHLSDKERCVVMMHGKITKYWGYSSKYHDRRDMQINDIFCDWHFEYFCGLEVPVITVKKSS